MNGKGDLIREDEFSYVWLDSYVFCTSNDAKEMLKNEFKVNIPRVINQFSWVEFLDAALPVLNVNFYQSIMMIAGAIACFHYPYSIKMAGNHLIYGITCINSIEAMWKDINLISFITHKLTLSVVLGFD